MAMENRKENTEVSEEVSEAEKAADVLAEAAADPFLERISEEYGIQPCGAEARRMILKDAEHCVCTDRNLLYGEPEDSFGMIARLWSAYLGMPVSKQQAIDMLILFKVARNGTAKKPCRDTYVDIAGYAACGGEDIPV